MFNQFMIREKFIWFDKSDKEFNVPNNKLFIGIKWYN